MTGQTKTVAVLRYRPEQDEAPVWQEYQVPYGDDTSVLAALNYIKDELDGTLSFRWSCRQAICGSCGMMIGGKPQLACKAFLRDYPERVTVEALAHFPIERDLVVVMDGFIDKLQKVKPYLIPREMRALEDGEYLQTPEEMDLYAQFAGCINCGLCYAACPQVGLNPDFLGPGAIALLHRYNLDSRDGGQAERMEMINAELGVFNCTAVGYCSEVCPKMVDPANAVNVNKMNSARDYFFRFLRPAPKQGGCR
ncbi:succinate dehydrogenase/fumarate reductase iron-sulfur subunit [Crenobacter caeni]|uniref:Succinate dehydrogenase iron-sulfur subunit n=1 Tax=Crenobacter caeni TaxID=2705474 RepID=A0A6B2KR51_9NEIS|nr:succinate dehydrogenase/fumarate reductase iron-sulfur subunit [Crenobacter caeni]NDV12531.1 succinate dehydrogenase/fumarate reductase iron-sulfur subunit [Crenobacter caeni]